MIGIFHTRRIGVSSGSTLFERSIPSMGQYANQASGPDLRPGRRRVMESFMENPEGKNLLVLIFGSEHGFL